MRGSKAIARGPILGKRRSDAKFDEILSRIRKKEKGFQERFYPSKCPHNL